jgi:hypothetical protein
MAYPVLEEKEFISPVSSTNKTDCHDITEILLKVALNTINQTLTTSKIHKYLVN